MTFDQADEAELHVDGLGEPEVRPFGDLDEQALDELEQADDQPLSDEEQRDLLAGLLEVPFDAAGWWLSRGRDDRVQAAIDETWQLPPATSTRLARNLQLAMPRSWRESRALQRLPLLAFGSQLIVLARIRLSATQQIIDAAEEGRLAPDTGSRHPEPAAPRGGSGARASGPGRAVDPDAARANGRPAADAPAGLGLSGLVSTRAAARRERRLAGAADGGAE